jgi:DNA ligase (NAD+)
MHIKSRLTPRSYNPASWDCGGNREAMTNLQTQSERDIDRSSREEAKSHTESLRREVRRHNYLYYVRNQPEDIVEYDRLFAALKRLQEIFPHLVTPDSPTQRVGAEPRQEFPVIAHVSPMLSLDASHEADKVRRVDERIQKALKRSVRYLLEEKFDGTSIELIYEDGILAWAATRGNGRDGEKLTANVRIIRSVPLRLSAADCAVPYIPCPMD